jgi:hypothetical protein
VQGAVRQFLYIDVDRVRSYLAQLDEGVLESVVDRAGSDKGAKISAQLFGVGPEGSISGTSGREESRSMQDLTFHTLRRTLTAKVGYSILMNPIATPTVGKHQPFTIPLPKAS